MNMHNHGPSFGSELDKSSASVPGAPENKGEKTNVPNGGVDAGLKSLDHYKRALPKWRYNLRQSIMPWVRWETPYLAYMQDVIRTPALDSYFAITANLGTHTFFTIGLPVLFWCGFAGFGKGLVHILASGVFWTGFLKDMCSMPRPLSPPLQRITMSGSAALEYGFPSTHSANAVSVAVYAVLLLRDPSNTFAPSTKLTLELLSYFYAFSIVFGRLYCGMHGFLDVIIGSLMGVVISIVEFYYGPPLDQMMRGGNHVMPLILALVVIVLVRVHPEPADDCPCFDDSVAFAGVVIGVDAGTWRLARSPWGAIYSGTAPSFNLSALGWHIILARIVVGVLIIFAWREVMKPILLKGLPHLFRVIERHGLSLPRRFFMLASQYENVPLRIRDDNVLPSVSDIPKLVRSIRGPGRGRSVSIGPQSAADAYETLAYRERRRRESMDSEGGVRSKSSLAGLRERAETDGATLVDSVSDDQAGKSVSSGVQSGRLAEYEHLMGQGTVVVTPPESSPTSENGEVLASVEEPTIHIAQHDELGEKEMFSRLVKPRVRYDVEVVTKLVVYTGIGWLATDFILVIFELTGILAARA